jgi:hypothetical protein
MREPRTTVEQLAKKRAHAVFSYFYNNPYFDRTNTDAASLGIAPPPITEDFLDRLVDFAIHQNWGH